jgi:AbrB family transcriptional regulator (stage V sporulation protein T)
MKATGIVRRIDDLGRVVIPKEIRRTMRIREGDPLEIYTDREGEVIFKKYSPIGELNSFAAQYAETLHKTGEITVLICDRDAVIAVSGAPRKEYSEKHISAELEAIIESRQLYLHREGADRLPPISDGGSHYIACAMPIISEGDILGCVVSLEASDAPARRTSEHEKSVEVKLVQTAAVFLGKQLES